MTEKAHRENVLLTVSLGKRNIIFSDAYSFSQNVCFLCKMPTSLFVDYGLIYYLQL